MVLVQRLEKKGNRPDSDVGQLHLVFLSGYETSKTRAQRTDCCTIHLDRSEIARVATTALEAHERRSVWSWL